MNLDEWEEKNAARVKAKHLEMDMAEEETKPSLDAKILAKRARDNKYYREKRAQEKAAKEAAKKPVEAPEEVFKKIDDLIDFSNTGEKSPRKDTSSRTRDDNDDCDHQSDGHQIDEEQIAHFTKNPIAKDLPQPKSDARGASIADKYISRDGVKHEELVDSEDYGPLDMELRGTALVRRRSTTSLVTVDDVKDAALEMAKAEAILAVADKVKNWAAADTAIEALIDCQEAIVTWWELTARRDGRPSKDEETRPEPGVLLKEADKEKILGIRHQLISKWRLRLSDRDGYRLSLRSAAHNEAMRPPRQEGEQGHRADFSGDNEWYTPPDILAAARECFGGTITTDPATSESAQQAVRAETYYTSANSGLDKSWYGNVWLNPPYSRDLLPLFVDKLLSEVHNNEAFVQAIMITHNFTDTEWFHKALNDCDALCLTKGRVKFHNQRGDISAPTQGSALFYFGKNVGGFKTSFEHIGAIVELSVPWREKETPEDD